MEDNMDVEYVCIICDKSNESSLKVLKEQQLNTLQRAADKRKSLSKDSFIEATERIVSIKVISDLKYHPTCLSRYTAVKAVKRVNPSIISETGTAKVTRSTSELPSTSSSGVLGDTCLFCPFKRKRVKSTISSPGQYEPLHQVETIDSARAIMYAAKHSSSSVSGRIMAIGEDLIAKEAKYHYSCKREFLRAQSGHSHVQIHDLEKSSRQKHDGVFQIMCNFIENHVIDGKKPMQMTNVLSLYREEYLAAGGDSDTFVYSVQSLTQKINSNIGGVKIEKESKKGGSFIYPCSMSLSEAQLSLKQSNEQMEETRRTAMVIRSEITNMSKTKFPCPTSVHTLKKTAPSIPPLTTTFFRTLMTGLNAQELSDVTERKINAMSSDAIFNCSRGRVKPLKNTIIGLGLSSLTGSKSVIKVLNRQGHSISYDDVKRLETEMAYSCTAEGRETPSGLSLNPYIATALAWDNYDVNIETLDGKNTLHVTVGICYQNQHHLDSAEDDSVLTLLPVRARRKYEGQVREIPEFFTSLKSAKFTFQNISDTTELLHNYPGIVNELKQNTTDFLWMISGSVVKHPLLNGYYSRTVTDNLPMTVISYMDPISQPPTRNDVVLETMKRSMAVTAENGQPYAIVSYDLAVALKAFSIQALKYPLYDKLIVMLGIFHLEMAFFGAVGTYLADSGIEYILTEYGILAEGSLNGFMKGKFYNRCTRIHQLTAAVAERLMLTMYMSRCPDNQRELLEELMTVTENIALTKSKDTDFFKSTMDGFEAFLHDIMKGEYGKTAQYWGIYVFMIGRVHRMLQRCVRTNDVDMFVKILPTIVDVFFALNRPNYARWGALFLDKLNSLPVGALDILKNGAFSIRRTQRSYARSTIDKVLEETVNRDAASSSTGIVAFSNSESAFRRWCVGLTQRSMSVSEMNAMSNIQSGETPANQLKKTRIERDNRDMSTIQKALENTCNPFCTDTPQELVNIASGKAAEPKTSKYLTESLSRGHRLQKQFSKECSEDSSRFLKRIKRTKVDNFASMNVKKNSTKRTKALGAAESVRDAFGHLLAGAAFANENLDMINILKFPITEVPLSIAQSDGTMSKTDKSKLVEALEGQYDFTVQSDALGPVVATIIDGGLLVHEVLLRHNRSKYGDIVRDLMAVLSRAQGNEVHLLLDKYITPSIKDCERSNRGSKNDDQEFVITGPDQIQKTKGSVLLKMSKFKEAFAIFLMRESQHNYYISMIGRKVIFISHGGHCIRLVGDSENGIINVTSPSEYQGTHEEADTLIAFHAGQIQHGQVVVRASDTDVLVILVGLAGRNPNLSITMDAGTGNNRRYLNISQLVVQLDKVEVGLSEGLVAFHALTGCDFTSSFYRKGKKVPLDKLIAQGQDTIMAVRSLTSASVDVSGVEAFVCHLYSSKRTMIDEARYDAFVKMTNEPKSVKQKGQGNIKLKKINCAALPPCQKTLHYHLKRVNYVAMLWRSADLACPTTLSPLEYGWRDGEQGIEPEWYSGDALPSSVDDDVSSVSQGDTGPYDSDTDIEDDDVQDEESAEVAEEDEEWSGDSESDEDDDDDETQ